MPGFDLKAFQQAMTLAKHKQTEAEALGTVQPSQGSPFYFGEINVVDIATAREGAGVNVDVPGYEFHILRVGSDPTVRLDVEFDVGQVRQMGAGSMFRAPFKRLVLKYSPQTTLQVGSYGTLFPGRLNKIRYCVVKTKDCTFNEVEGGNNGRIIDAVIGTQGYNKTSGLENVPTLTTSGISLQGVVGLRAMVLAQNGATITAGNVRWWVYSDLITSWAPTEISYALPLLTTAQGIVAIPDEMTLVGQGRAYLELSGYTDSGGGAFDPFVYIEAMRQ
jgi:hypothetical protein